MKNSENNIHAIHEELNRAFRTLILNAHTYVRLNEKLQQPTPRGLWIERFKHRADKTHQLYDQNNKLVERITHICMRDYATDIQAYNNDIRYTDLEKLGHQNTLFFIFDKLCHLIYDRNLFRQMPFLIESICQRFGPDVQRLMPRSEIAMLILASQLETQCQIAMLVEKSAIRQIAPLARKILTFEPHYDDFSSDFVRMRFLSAYRALLTVDNIINGAVKPALAIKTWDRFRSFCASYPHSLGITDMRYANDLTEITDLTSTFIPVYYGKFHIRFKDNDNDTWIRRELRQYVDEYPYADPENRDPKTFHMYTYVKWAIGDWTPNEAYNAARDFYTPLRINADERHKHMSASKSLNVTRVMLTMLSHTDLPYEIKKVRIVQALDIVIQDVRDCTDRNFSYELTHIIGKILCSSEINQYLSTDERRSFLHSLFRNSLVQVYAHSRAVATISEVLLDAVIHHQPELLVGNMGIRTSTSVPAKAKLLTDYLIGAASIHDIGKTTLVQLVRSEFIKTSPHECEILERHPERGLQFINMDPSFAKYHDPILYHHKWYDGTHGFPKGDQNTRSRYRLFTDIISIAGFLESGTDNLGRPDKRSYTFSSLIAELRKGAGTRFNPDLVRLITDYSSLYHALSELTLHGWEYNYYEVYLDYFDKR